MSHEQEPLTSPQQWFHEVATHYVEAQILFHLNQVGVFRELAKGPATGADLANRLDLRLDVLDALLAYVVGVDRLLEIDAQSRYALTGFGEGLLERYGRTDPTGERFFNFFDVRVGAYQPVWSALGAMLRGDKEYGRDVHREGAYAADGTYKIAPRMMPFLVDLVREYRIESLVEIGVPTGMLAHLAPHLPDTELIGIDKDPNALDEAHRRALALGLDRIRFVRGDFFRPEGWRDAIDPDRRGLIFSLHMHELAAAGLDAMEAVLVSLRAQLPKWHMVALEQDRLPPSKRHTLPQDLWLYAQSNVLIHHLLKNARILSREEWTALFTGAGCEVRAVKPLGYLGYHGYMIALRECSCAHPTPVDHREADASPGSPASPR
jgi:hypothetical protein